LQAVGRNWPAGNGHAIQGVAQAGDEFDALAKHFIATAFAGGVGETVEIQHVAEHTQQLPGRTGIAARLGDPIETLHTAFDIDEGPGSFGERRNRQHHVGVFQSRCMLEGGHGDHQAGLLQRANTSCGLAQSNSGSMPIRT
jgi:hypothetical protein